MSSLISQVSERFTAIVLRLQAHIQELRVQGVVGNAAVLLIYVFVGLELVRMIWLRVRWLCHEIVVPLYEGLAIDKMLESNVWQVPISDRHRTRSIWADTHGAVRLSGS